MKKRIFTVIFSIVLLTSVYIPVLAQDTLGTDIGDAKSKETDVVVDNTEDKELIIENMETVELSANEQIDANGEIKTITSCETMIEIDKGEALNSAEKKSNNQEDCDGVYNEYTYKIKDNNTIAITKFKRDKKNEYDAILKVPKNIDGYKVTEIGVCAFEDAEFDEIVLPNTIKKIGEDAFVDSKIKAITIPESVTELEDVCFARCYNLQEATILGEISKCGSQMFLDCENLETVVLGEGIKVLGEQFFNGCTSLKTVEIPSTVKYLDTNGPFGNAFAFSSLENIVISEKNKNFKIIDGVVYTYDGTKLIYAPVSVDKHIIPLTTKEIGTMAFCENNLIEEIIIPASVDTVSQMAFDYCDNLKKFYFCNPDASLDNSAIFAYNFFSGWDPSDIKIYGFKKSTAFDLAEAEGMCFKKFSDNSLEYVCNTVGHYYLKKNGKKQCTVCANIKSKPGETTALNKKLQTITAKNITKTYGDKAFNIGAKTDGKGNLSYISDNKKVATVSESGKVTIKGCGKATITIKVSETEEYKASEKKITITVKPKKQKVTSLKSTKVKTINIKWKKDVKASGYILQYSTSKNFKKNVKSITVSNNKTTSKKISKLKAGKKYYVRICSYKKVSGEKVKGSYSTVKSVKVKK